MLAGFNSLRKNESIEILQVIPQGVELRVDHEVATAAYQGSPIARWPATRVTLLSAEHARSLVALGASFVFAERAAREALETLQSGGVSYATAAREWFLWQPPGVLLVVPPVPSVGVARASSGLFSKGTARVARAFLLRRIDDGATIREVARSTALSEATVSRGVAQLDSRRLLRVEVDAGDARRRRVSVPDRGALLEALADDGRAVPLLTATWGVGARTVSAAIAEVVATGKEGYPYALGELAGASFRTRVAEPALSTVWVRAMDLEAWQSLLVAAPAPPAPAEVQIRVARDPAVLDWADDFDGVSVADPVQLYLDCRNSSERAVEAAAVLRQEIVG